MNRSRIVQAAAFIVVIVLYIALRFRDLTASCLWFDEIFSVHAAEHSWDSILNFVSLDLIHPPLFYVLLKLWIAAGGESLFWLRFFPVLFSIVTIVPFAYLCRELRLGGWTTALALFLIAINGSLIKYSQEVRMYSMLLGLSLFSTWLFARYFRTGKSFAFLTFVNVLLVYTHYFGWLLILIEILTILIYQRMKLRRIMLMIAIVIVAFIPWGFAVLHASHTSADLGQNIGWMSRPGPIEIGTLILNLIEPFYYSATSIDPISIFRVTIPLLTIILTAVVLCLARGPNVYESQDHSIDLPLLFAGIPVLTAFVASWMLPYSIWGTRHLIIVFPPVLVLIAAAFGRISNFKFKAAFLTLGMLFIFYGFALDVQSSKRVYSWCAWQSLTEQVLADEPVSRKTNIYALEDLAAYSIWFTLRHDSGNRPGVFKFTGIQGVREDKAYFLPRGFEDIKTVNLSDLNEQRFWLANRGKPIEELEHPITDILAKGYRITDRRVLLAGSEFAMFYLFEK